MSGVLSPEVLGHILSHLVFPFERFRGSVPTRGRSRLTGIRHIPLAARNESYISFRLVKKGTTRPKVMARLFRADVRPARKLSEATNPLLQSSGPSLDPQHLFHGTGNKTRISVISLAGRPHPSSASGGGNSRCAARPISRQETARPRSNARPAPPPRGQAAPPSSGRDRGRAAPTRSRRPRRRRGNRACWRYRSPNSGRRKDRGRRRAPR